MIQARKHISSDIPSSALFSLSQDSGAPTVPAPRFDGNLVFPMRAFSIGLKGHIVAAVYAVMNNSHKRGAQDSWSQCEFVGLTLNLDKELESLKEKHGAEKMAHVRAMSYPYPQRVAMEELANKWLKLSKDAGGNADCILVESQDWEIASSMEDSVEGNNGLETGEEKENLRRALESTKYLFEDDDDDDDDDDDYGYFPETKTETTEPGDVISPFSESKPTSSTSDALIFNKSNVDKVLDEVRPYLISDGGNVSVQSIDEETKNVYLVLEGACGSCPSSTVTMQMGIERVLKENFPDLGEVLQVQPETDETAPTELTLGAVQAEVKRLSHALTAMGGVIRIVDVDPIGVVEIEFRGSNKIRHGLELALLDVPFVKHVKFVN